MHGRTIRGRWTLAIAAGLAVALFAAPAGAKDTVVGGFEGGNEAVGGTRIVAPTVWFQGYLADANTGDPLSGFFNVEASIYAAELGGITIWGPELHTSTILTQGWFNIELGESVALPAFDDPPYYLQLEIDGEVLSPRQKLGSVPTAFHANDTYEADGDWMIYPGGVYRTGGNVGIGTSSPFGRLEVLADDEPGVIIANTGLLGNLGLEVANEDAGSAGGFFAQTGPVVYPTNPAAVFGYTQDGGDGGFFHGSDGGKGVFAQSSEDGPALYARALDGGYSGYFTGGNGVFVTGAAEEGGWFENSLLADEGIALYGQYNGPSGSYDPVGVGGYSRPQDYYGVGGLFVGGWRGVVGEVYVTGASNYAGVAGFVDGGFGNNRGVSGIAFGSGVNHGIYGYAAYGSTNYAGYFLGDINVTGVVDAAAVTIKRDYPLDPANQYLTQWAVESAEMTSVLNGNVVLDAGGEAAVGIPEWYVGTTRDHRFQLTCVGGFAPVYVAEEIAGGVFRIAGGEPGMKVSWQVTGVRDDLLAQAERTTVVSEKPADERGTYLTPALYGMPATARIGYDEEDEARRRKLREVHEARRSRVVEEDSGTGLVPASVKR